MKRFIRFVVRLIACLLIAIAPALAVVLMMVASWGYRIWFEIDRLPASGAAYEALKRFGGALQSGGPLGMFLIAANYVTSFGLISVLTIILMRRWNAKRVVAFWALCVAFIIDWLVATGHPLVLRLQPSIVPVIYEMGIADDWKWYLISYPWYVLPLAIGFGYVASLLRIFQPGPRYWLSRGMCPMCHYDLKGEADKGCPECGWKRNSPKTV